MRGLGQADRTHLLRGAGLSQTGRTHLLRGAGLSQTGRTHLLRRLGLSQAERSSPFPISIISNQRIVLPDIPAHSPEMLLISNRRIPILALPECPLPRLPRCKFPRNKPLEISHDLSQFLSLERHQQRMQMIWHDNKGIKRISTAIIMPQCRLNNLASVRFSKNTRSVTGIEPFLHCTLKAFRILPRTHLIPRLRMLFKPNATIFLKRSKLVHRQRITKAECHKDGNTRLLPMRQISAPGLNRGKAGKKSGRLQRAVWDRPRPLCVRWQYAVWDRPHPLCADHRGVGLSQADIAHSLFFHHLHWFASEPGLRLSLPETRQTKPKHHNQHSR